MRGIRDAIFSKVKRSGKNTELNKDILGTKLNQVQQHIHDWPSSYQRRKQPGEKRARESILGKLDGVVYIIGYYLSQLHGSNNRNKTNFNMESGGNFN